jgi:GNAT superfamily N-acetyltransferase
MGTPPDIVAADTTFVPLDADALRTDRVVGDVADLLQRAWDPPCLWYSPEYLRWQFGMPGRAGARGIGAFQGSRLIGFIGVVPRGVRVGDWEGEVAVLSFLAVAADARGHGLARRLYDAILSRLHEAPIVLFTQPDTAGDRVMRASFADTAYSVRTLGVCRTYGGTLLSQGVTGAHTNERVIATANGVSLYVERVTDYARWLRVLSAQRADAGQAIGAQPPRSDRLTAWPDAAAFAHYQRDPRERTFHLVRDADGRVLAGASAVQFELRTASGIARSPTIELIVLHESDPAVLTAVVRHAPVANAAEPMVIAPNLSSEDEALLRPAGLRATRSQFLAHLCCRPEHPVAAASHTNLEVV